MIAVVSSFSDPAHYTPSYLESNYYKALQKLLGTQSDFVLETLLAFPLHVNKDVLIINFKDEAAEQC